VSISSTFYASFFEQNFGAKIYKPVFWVWNFGAKNFVQKNSCVKRWWNWLQKALGGGKGSRDLFCAKCKYKKLDNGVMSFEKWILSHHMGTIISPNVTLMTVRDLNQSKSVTYYLNVCWMEATFSVNKNISTQWQLEDQK